MITTAWPSNLNLGLPGIAASQVPRHHCNTHPENRNNETMRQ